MTKLVTAVAVMQCVEKGLVGLEDDLGKVVSELSSLDVLEGFDDDGKPVLKKQAKAITFRYGTRYSVKLHSFLCFERANKRFNRNLLSHTSGFGYDVMDPMLIKWRQSIGSDINCVNSFTLEALKIPLRFQPGDSWMYGVGCDWAGYTVEKLTGLSLEEYMQQNIFKPLGMTSTTFRVADYPDLGHRRAQMSFRAQPGAAISAADTFTPDVNAMDWGGVGLKSTAADYSKLLAALLNGGRGILKATSVSDLLASRLSDTKELEGYFFGDYHGAFCPEYPRNIRVNFALAGAVNVEDVPGKRRAGTVMWSGATNPHWVSI